MAFFGIFGSDPVKTLDRAAARLERGDPTGARELAEPLRRAKDPAHRERALEICDQARRALLASTLERAGEAEAKGWLEDAADWLEAALQHAPETERGALEERRAALLARAAEGRLSGGSGAAREVEVPRDDDGEAAAALDEEPWPETDAGTPFDTLVGILRDDLADDYAERSEAFRDAWVALNEGRGAEALPVLDELVAAHPDDPVYRLERGRCRLLMGDAAGARADLEAAWEHFGDAPLDLAGSLSLPLIWAQALLDLGEPAAIVDRLAEAADPAEGHPELSKLYAQALLATSRPDEAREFLSFAAAAFPKDPEVAYLLGRALHLVGERAEAIACLETAIAPSCSPGGCGRVPFHPPSLRLLAALHLDQSLARAQEREEGEPELDDWDQDPSLTRAGELIGFVNRAQGGRFTAEDHHLAARYFERAGHPDAARRAEAEAERLEELVRAAGPGPGEPLPFSPPIAEIGGRAVL